MGKGRGKRRRDQWSRSRNAGELTILFAIHRVKGKPNDCNYRRLGREPEPIFYGIQVPVSPLDPGTPCGQKGIYPLLLLSSCPVFQLRTNGPTLPMEVLAS